MVDEMISICEHIAQAEEFVESLRKFKNIDKKALNKVSQLQHFVMSCYSEDKEAVKDVKKMLHKERIRVKGEVLKKLKGI